MQISTYKPTYASDFKTLNIEWLETFFYVESYDNEVLSNPEKYIVSKGGHIFFALIDDTVVGTVALMPMQEPNVYELTKMAVDTSIRGKGIGQKLMAHCIAFAKAENTPKLVLYSNTILENAIYIYKKWGFVEIPLETTSNYDRANIKMELILHKH
ncbi:GNAT family N-acetyltransferase [uncultured Dokdonia sp.]|uniref:GNAT family N-acetyltransferase n=1 Tax=uncultured Dokdonia sp. TaxID=575653 RepID=UPI002605A675|nr:GNAT family N-acetyltransferase [uncultured Dokdonia sp.]